MGTSVYRDFVRHRVIELYETCQMSLLTKPSLLMLMSANQPQDKSGKWIRVLRNTPVGSVEWPASVETQVTNVGFDVTLGAAREPFDLNTRSCLQTLKDGSSASSYVLVPAGHTISVETAETLKLGFGIAALIKSKVRMVSKGFSHISTTIDPGWEAPLLLTFTNQTAFPIRLSFGSRIATIVFFEASAEVTDLGDATPEHMSRRWDTYHTDARKRASILLPLSYVVTTVVMVLLIIIVGWYFHADFSQLWNEKKDAALLEKVNWIWPPLAFVAGSYWYVFYKIRSYLRRRFPSIISAS